MLDGIALADPAKATKRPSRKVGFATAISGKRPATSQHTDETPPKCGSYQSRARSRSTGHSE
jgi:hypothetical protein